MKEIKMIYHSDSFIPALASIFALLMAELSISIPDDNLLKSITAVSSIVLCLTAMVKLVDLCIEKLPKWRRAYLRWARNNFYKKPPTL